MSLADPIYLIFLTTGFSVGFGHCIGMCGPIVVSLSLNLKERPTFVPHLLYNSGRITTYALLGGLAGLTGSFVSVAHRIAGIQKGAMIFDGVVIILMGLAMSGWIRWGEIFGDVYKPLDFITKGFQKLSAAKSVFAYYPLGMVLGFLPCGSVYTALIASAGAGVGAHSTFSGFLSGSGVMIAFGIGTLPALMLVGKLSDLGWIKSRALIYKIGAVLMILAGAYFIFKGIRY